MSRLTSPHRPIEQATIPTAPASPAASAGAAEVRRVTLSTSIFVLICVLVRLPLQSPPPQQFPITQAHLQTPSRRTRSPSSEDLYEDQASKRSRLEGPESPLRSTFKEPEAAVQVLRCPSVDSSDQSCRAPPVPCLLFLNPLTSIRLLVAVVAPHDSQQVVLSTSSRPYRSLRSRKVARRRTVRVRVSKFE